MLDSVQGRPQFSIVAVVSVPELETWIETWAFSETISRSYTHINEMYIRFYKVFDEMLNIKEPQIAQMLLLKIMN